MAQQAALERQALEQLRRGDLDGARGTLGLLARLRPDDSNIQRRLKQVEELAGRRADARARMQAEPLRYAHAYIKAGRLEEGLRLLRAALAKDPENGRLRELALQVARRLRASTEASQTPSKVAERQAAEDALKARTRRPASSRPTPVSSVPKPPSADAHEVPAPAITQTVAPPDAPPPRFPPPRLDSAREASVEALPIDMSDRLKTLLERVRSRRRAPSRWLGSTSLERR